MRLSDVLSKPINDEYVGVDGFLNGKRLARGKQQKINVGKIVLPYFCNECNDTYTFTSDEVLFCIGVNDHLISIDCVLKCPKCDSSVQAWFLITCYNDIHSSAPQVRILKRGEKLSDTVSLDGTKFGAFANLLERSHRAYREGLGAGSIIYLRKAFEQITVVSANACVPVINTKTSKGKSKKFSELLKEVDAQCSIVPKEFSENGYKLFGELSNVLHGHSDEEEALRKYQSFRRLVVGVLDNIRNNKELLDAINALGWNNEGVVNVED